MANALIPELIVSNFEKSLHFYTKILGFKIDYDRPEKKFAMLSLEGSQLMINERNGWWETGIFEYPLGRGINLQIKISDIDRLLNFLKINNIVLYQELEEAWYRKGDREVGHKEFLVQDPDGYLLRFVQDIGERDVVKGNIIL